MTDSNAWNKYCTWFYVFIENYLVIFTVSKIKKILTCHHHCHARTNHRTGGNVTGTQMSLKWHQ